MHVGTAVFERSIGFVGCMLGRCLLRDELVVGLLLVMLKAGLLGRNDFRASGDSY